MNSVSMKTKRQKSPVFTFGDLVKTVYENSSFRGRAIRLTALLVNSGRVRFANFNQARVVGVEGRPV